MNVAVSSKKPKAQSVEDVQGHADTRQIPINKVGIKDIYHPVKVKDRSRGEQHTVANFNMYVNLPHNFKGTHMSRFVEILHRHEREISVESFGMMLAEMTEHLAASSGHIEMTFPYFVMKKAPVSGVESLMNYQATIFGEHRDGKTEVWLKVVVPNHESLPLLEGNLGLRRAQPAIAYHADREARRTYVAGGTDRDRGARGLLRGLRDIEATG